MSNKDLIVGTGLGTVHAGEVLDRLGLSLQALEQRGLVADLIALTA